MAFLLGYCVNFFVNFLMNSIAFWTLETFAVQLIVRWASDLLSGQVIPLTFFPGILGRIVFALPFAAIYSTPLLIYVGDHSSERVSRKLRNSIDVARAIRRTVGIRVARRRTKGRHSRRLATERRSSPRNSEELSTRVRARQKLSTRFAFDNR